MAASSQKEELDLCCLRILIQFALHASPDELRGTYPCPDFAALLRSGLFCGSDYLSYASSTILTAWTNRSQLQKSLVSCVQGPSCALFNECPRKGEQESPRAYAERLHNYLRALNRHTQYLHFEIRTGIEWTVNFRKDVETSLSSLLTEFDGIPSVPHFVSIEIERTRLAIHNLISALDQAEEVDIDGNTILHLLATQDNESLVVSEMAELFMNWTSTSQAMLNHKNRLSETPVYLAARAGHLLTVQFLVQRGASINIATEDGDSTLSAAMRSGNVELVVYLMHDGAIVDPLNKRGDTPLHVATTSGYPQIVSYLIDRGEDFNRQNNFGETPISLAAEYNLWEILELFMAKGIKNDDE